MTAFTGALANVPQGLNKEGQAISAHTVAQSTTSGDTLALSKPEGFDADLTPVDVVAVVPGSPDTFIRNMAMTSFSKTTGVLTITPSTTLPVGAILVVTYANLGVR